MLVKSMLGSHSPLLGGLGLFVLAASAGVAVLILQRQEPVRMLILGAGALLAGVGIVLAALPSSAIVMFFLGTAVAGVGFGTGFQGSVRTVVAHAAPHERAGVLSVVFIVSYLAMGVPAVIAGAMVARHGDILQTAMVFAAAVIALAAAALAAGALRTMTRRAGG
jgi:MFS family permease